MEPPAVTAAYKVLLVRAHGRGFDWYIEADGPGPVGCGDRWGWAPTVWGALASAARLIRRNAT